MTGRETVSMLVGLLGRLSWVAAVFVALPGFAQEAADADADYLRRFHEQFPEVLPIPKFDEYATVARFDNRSLGDRLAPVVARVPEKANDTGGMAWGTSAWMMAFNTMYRATEDPKYLDANLKIIRVVADATDDKRGKTLWTGKVAPAWGCGKYAQRGRAVFAVHTGMITYPMFEFLLHAKDAADFRASLGDEYDVILKTATDAIAFHDRQWRDGPAPGEGHYIGLDQEDVCENKPLPGNRLSAMGRALWLSWKLTGSTTHRDRALAMGLYIKNRFTVAPDGAYYWPYWLPIEPAQPGERTSVKGEDSSHGGLTAAFPMMLGLDGQVFTEADMKRLGNTVVHGFARLGDGIILGNITGTPGSNPKYAHGGVARWLPTASYVPEAGERILEFFLRYQPDPGPRPLALLIEHRTGKS